MAPAPSPPLAEADVIISSTLLPSVLQNLAIAVDDPVPRCARPAAFTDFGLRASSSSSSFAPIARAPSSRGNLQNSMGIAALIMLSALTRARGGADSSKLRRRPTCTGRLGGAAAAGRRRHFFLAELLFADSGATMELGRSAPMLTWASPSRAAAMVPAPVEGSQLRGHRQRSPNSAAPTVGALSRARSALRIGKISGIWPR